MFGGSVQRCSWDGRIPGVYGARQVQSQGAMACTGFEYLKRRLGTEPSRGSVYVDIEQGDYKICIGWVELGMSILDCLRRPSLGLLA